MILDNFKIGFWHPAGAYGGLSFEEIVKWKHDEAERYGWTLWSFAHTPLADQWFVHVNKESGPVHVLCSVGPRAKDPHPSKPPLATYFRFHGEGEHWGKMPDEKEMHVTNPFKKKELATAFVVMSVHQLDGTAPDFGVSWYSKGDWREDRLPSMGQYLVRRGGKAKLRRVHALLELKPPYLATITNSEKRPES